MGALCFGIEVNTSEFGDGWYLTNKEYVAGFAFE